MEMVAWSEVGRAVPSGGGTGLGFLLYSPAHDGGHIKWPPVRAELAINLSRCPRSPGACGYVVVACGSLFGTGLIISRCKALLVVMVLGRLSCIGRFLGHA